MLARLAPWPDDARGAPLNQELSGDQSHAKIRLCFALSRLEHGEALDLLSRAAKAAQKLYVADYTLAERNLALPAHGLTRLMDFGAKKSFWRAGALWGLARAAGLEPFYERVFMCGAAALAGFAGKNAK